MPQKFKDVTGQIFGRLTAEEMVARSLDKRQSYWRCACTCGTILLVPGARLRSGNTKSCGCLNLESTSKRSTKHGHSKRKTRTYKCWSNMLSRCNNPKFGFYANYGGRGIKVCARWRNFNNFLSDMGVCPPGLTIERIDNNGNYEPGNCKWATPYIQGRNKRNNIHLTHRGITMIQEDWEQYYDCPCGTISRQRKQFNKGDEEVFRYLDNKYKDNGLARLLSNMQRYASREAWARLMAVLYGKGAGK